MFVGHFAPALVAAARPNAPGLGTLFVGAQLVDIGFALLLIPGVEAMRLVPGITAMNPMDLYHMPYTHSLLGAALWGIVVRPAGLGGDAAARCRDSRGAGRGVALVHRPCRPYPRPDAVRRAAKYGFGLWNRPLIAMPLEIAITAAAFFYYATRTRGAGSNRRLWVLAILLIAVQAADWFGPKDAAYSLAIPATMLGAYALLALTAAWAGADRRRVTAAAA